MKILTQNYFSSWIYFFYKLLLSFKVHILIHSRLYFRGKLDDFMSTMCRYLFNCLQIDASFLQECPSSWNNNTSYFQAKRKVNSLIAVSDSAERGVKLMQPAGHSRTINRRWKIEAICISLCARPSQAVSRLQD